MSYSETKSNPMMRYFEQENALHLVISNDLETDSVEISPNITAELNSEGELIGIEILNASVFLQNSILESCKGSF